MNASLENNRRALGYTFLIFAVLLLNHLWEVGQVGARNMVFFQPEIFYYAGVRVDAAWYTVPRSK